MIDNENLNDGYPNTSSAQYCESYFSTCVDLGVKSADLFDILQASPRSFANPLYRFRCDAILDMIAHAQNVSGHCSIGLMAGTHFRPSTFLDVGQAFISANSLRHALRVNAKYQRLTQQFGTTGLEVDRQSARVTWAPYIEDAERLRPITEAVYAGYVSIGRWLLWHYNEDALVVRFRHSRPCDPDPCAEYFGCDIQYDQDLDCLEFKAALADFKLPQANPELLKTLESRLDRSLENLDNLDRVTSKVHQSVLYTIGKVPVTAESIAEMIDYTPAGMARGLKDEGSSFRDILRDVRRQNAEFYLLENRKTLAEISLALGYSDQSAFTRAYRSWHGVPPSQMSQR
ncbi:MAG: AraC family transcriptional regulator ligand-binding domain-containing protein [Erythrobacter sp.]|uniref:AraC family transcriptional regulator n=1 Tax=Erythrobacter sp. TaxID=1042 RepID=UPI0032675DF4